MLVEIRITRYAISGSKKQKRKKIDEFKKSYVLHIAREENLTTSEVWALVRPYIILKKKILNTVHIICNLFSAVMAKMFLENRKGLRNI